LLFALLSDVHANIEALSACLADARARGAARYVFLGDLVGYGADPEAVVDVARRHAADGAVVLQGNHDAWAVAPAGSVSEGAQDSIVWTREHLSTNAKSWLGSLPLCVREGRICFVHASAAAPGRWEYVDNARSAKKSAEAAGVPWTFCGHVHQQMLFFEPYRGRMSSFAPAPGVGIPVGENHRWVAVVGSAGQPRERNPAAAYALFDSTRATITFLRVAYDHDTAARKMRAAGLPDTLHWSGR
jgi:diadenosine tetraphosphatase ApaH/serine/threonine PP2A family protein phosphatase